MFDHLFSPVRINGLELKNRIILPAMGSRFCTEDGRVIQQLIDFHTARVDGGCAMNVVEAVSINKTGAVTSMLQISDDSYIEGFRKLTDAIHEHGGTACIQLWESGIASRATPGSKPLLPSDIPLGPNMVMKGATVEEIHTAVEQFGQAAKRAAEAGFDAVEFHAAHFYSPHEFLTPAFNRRTDEYGGSKENRARYLLESIRSIRDNIPADMPLIMRIDSMDDDLPGGLTTEDIIEFCLWAKEAGVDALSISRGNKLSPRAMNLEVPSIDIPRGFNIEPAARIKEGTGMITIGVGRINDPEMADSYVREGKVDIVAMGRAQLSDPNFANKARDGRADDIVRCIGCNQGCYDHTFAGKPITCLRNPEVGREKEFAALKKTETPKKVLVIGGGVGGIEAAIRADSLGHHVTLAEKSGQLGGQFILAGKAPRKGEMEAAALSRAEQLKKTSVNILMDTEVNEAFLDEFKPEAVISAVGAHPVTLSVEGIDSDRVLSANDVLAGKAEARGNTVVIGGGLVGLETAEFVRAKGNPVTVIEMLDEVGKDIGVGRKAPVMVELKISGIVTEVNAKCTKVSDNGVEIEQNGETRTIPADTVIIAVGSEPNNSDFAEKWCETHQVFFRKIGDAVKARRALNAIHEGVEAAIAIG